VTLQRLPIALTLSLACLCGTACITETEGSGRQAQGMRTEGVIVTGDIDAVWSKTQSVIDAMATAPLTSRGVDRSLRTEVMGKEVKAFVERYDSQRTVVHVQCDDSEVADRIRMRIMQP